MLLLLDIISRDGQLLLRPIVVVLVVGIILCVVNGDDRCVKADAIITAQHCSIIIANITLILSLMLAIAASFYHLETRPPSVYRQ